MVAVRLVVGLLILFGGSTPPTEQLVGDQTQLSLTRVSPMASSKEFWQQHSIREKTEQEHARSRAANAARGARVAQKNVGMRDVRTVGRIISGSPGARFREEQVA